MVADLLTIREVAQLLRVPIPRAYELAREGVIPGVVRIGRQIRIDSGQLYEFVKTGGKGLDQAA